MRTTPSAMTRLRRPLLVGALVLSGCRAEIAGPSPAAQGPTGGTACEASCSDAMNEAPLDAGAIAAGGSDSGSRPEPVFDSGMEADTGVIAPIEDASSPDSTIDAAPPLERQLGTIISLGDSITVGHSGGYQAQVAARIAAAGHSFTGDIINDGHSGWQMIRCNVDGIYQILEPDLAQHQPDTVLLMIGTNDIGGGNLPDINLESIGHPEVDCSYEQAPLRLNLLIEKIHAQRPTAMIFVSNIIPLILYESSYIESEKYAAKVAELVRERVAGGDALVAPVDVWTEFPRATGYQDDKVHPNVEGQRFIGERFSDAILLWLNGGLNGS